VEAAGLAAQENKMSKIVYRIFYGVAIGVVTGFVLFTLLNFVWVFPNMIKCSNECSTQQDMPIGDYHVLYDECKCENSLFSFPHETWENVYE